MDQPRHMPRSQGEGAPQLDLVLGDARYPVLDCGSQSCLVAAPQGAVLRGYAYLYEGERLVAHCLIVLAEPEGNLLRCRFKQRTPARSSAPTDYALTPRGR